MNKIFTLLLVAMLFATSNMSAQCPVGQSTVVITVNPDNYPAEISWDLKDATGAILASDNTITGGVANVTSVCIPSSGCVTFTIHDSFGDGICCAYGNGNYTVTLNGTTVASGSSYTTQQATSFNCGPGQSCSSALPAVVNTIYTAPNINYWYTFNPDSMGNYTITTCGLGNSCDTKIWIYETCTGILIDTTNVGTLYFDDNSSCGVYAVVSAALDSSKTYIIRIGGRSDCIGQNINWEINYNGPITGCLDPSSCNYNPLATVSDGNCLYFPDPNCPNGPDLAVDQNLLINSLSIGTQAADVCAVQEGCLNGYGNRTVINFSTRIDNVGNADYFIGNATNNPGQFNTTNCHGHAHYEGYAEYVLYKQNGQSVPIGFKNGFCVLDLTCPPNIPGQYGCGNMGITAGCGDIYSSGLSCQWIDITDVDPGQYVLAVKVNWDQSPDALGHYETDYMNNWGQVCVDIHYDVNGNKTFTQIANCQPYTDCLGVQFGNTVQDCNGMCGGTAKMGDLDNNSMQEIADGQNYVTSILANTIGPSTCYDLNANGSITVFDAALVTNCAKHGTSTNTKCLFPHGINNPTQTVTFSLGAINTTAGYVDIYMQSPNTNVLGYEINLSGLTILNVQNLVPASDYPTTPDFMVGGNKIISLSYIDSTISKFNTLTPVCRVYYQSLTSSQVCITSVVDVVNKNYETVNKAVATACISSVGIEKYVDANNYFIAQPNPSTGLFNLLCSFKNADNAKIIVTDILGKQITTYNANLNNNANYSLDLSALQNGVYYISIKTDAGVSTQKVVVEK